MLWYMYLSTNSPVGVLVLVLIAFISYIDRCYTILVHEDVYWGKAPWKRLIRVMVLE